MGIAAAKLSRIAFALGALCTVALLAGLVGWLFGETSFPAPFTGGEAAFGAYAWQTGSLIAGTLLLSRGLFAFAVWAGYESDDWQHS